MTIADYHRAQTSLQATQQTSVKLDAILTKTITELKGLPMPVEIKGLSEIVRRARESLSRASDSSAKLVASVNNLVVQLDSVDAMRQQIDQNAAELQGVLAALSNGGPSLLDSTAAPETGSPA